AHLFGARDANALGEQHRQAPTGHHPDTRVRVGEPGAVRSDQEVAVERDLEAAGDRNAVDRSDQRLDVRRQRAPKGQAAVGSAFAYFAEALALLHLAGAELLEVDARAERGIGPGED